MANIIIGTNGSIGAGSTLMKLPSHPHWKMAVTTTYAAPIDSRFITTAFRGTSSDRNTSIRRTNDSTSTTAMNAGSLAVRYSEKSTVAATVPDTATTSPVPSV